MMMKRTKIICTLGPATDNEEVLGALMDHGMDVARFNFSHGSHEEQKTRFELLKKEDIYGKNHTLWERTADSKSAGGSRPLFC